MATNYTLKFPSFSPYSWMGAAINWYTFPTVQTDPDYAALMAEWSKRGDAAAAIPGQAMTVQDMGLQWARAMGAGVRLPGSTLAASGQAALFDYIGGNMEFARMTAEHYRWKKLLASNYSAIEIAVKDAEARLYMALKTGNIMRVDYATCLYTWEATYNIDTYVLDGKTVLGNYYQLADVTLPEGKYYAGYKPAPEPLFPNGIARLQFPSQYYRWLYGIDYPAAPDYDPDTRGNDWRNAFNKMVREANITEIGRALDKGLPIENANIIAYVEPSTHIDAMDVVGKVFLVAVAAYLGSALVGAISGATTQAEAVSWGQKVKAIASDPVGAMKEALIQQVTKPIELAGRVLGSPTDVLAQELAREYVKSEIVGAVKGEIMGEISGALAPKVKAYEANTPLPVGVEVTGPMVADAVSAAQGAPVTDVPPIDRKPFPILPIGIFLSLLLS